MKNKSPVAHTWNHRLIQKTYVLAKGTEHEMTEVSYAIHEVHYKNGKPVAWTEEPTPVWGDSVKDVKWVLKMMKRCLDKPILKIVGKKRQRLVEI